MDIPGKKTDKTWNMLEECSRLILKLYQYLNVSLIEQTTRLFKGKEHAEVEFIVSLFVPFR